MPKRIPDPADFRTRLLAARFTEAEAARHEATAAAGGMTISDLIRAALDGTPPPRRRALPSPDREALIRVLAALGSARGNLNQLAYVANTGGWPESRAIADAVADIVTMRDALLTALGQPPPPDPAGRAFRSAAAP